MIRPLLCTCENHLEKKDRHQGDEVFELSEGRLFGLTPPPTLILLCEIKEWSCMMREVLDEP